MYNHTLGKTFTLFRCRHSIKQTKERGVFMSYPNSGYCHQDRSGYSDSSCCSRGKSGYSDSNCYSHDRNSYSDSDCCSHERFGYRGFGCCRRERRSCFYLAGLIGFFAVLLALAVGLILGAVFYETIFPVLASVIAFIAAIAAVALGIWFFARRRVC